MPISVWTEGKRCHFLPLNSSLWGCANEALMKDHEPNLPRLRLSSVISDFI